MQLTVDIEKRIGNFHLAAAFSTDTERFALLGASGSGKSMTLKCIAGIERPDRGRILLGDRVLFDSEKKIDIPARDRRIGYLFQEYALFPKMTVRQNITCMAGDKAYAEGLMERFALKEVADQYPAELSGGQSQRTAMARMLSVKPQAILLDEPFSALDNYLKSIMEHEILDLLDDFSGPAVLVSHDRNEVYRLAGQIGVMDRGSLVEIRDKQEFFDHPRTVAAARLTGCKNISRIGREGDGSVVALDWGIRVSLPEACDLTGIDHIGYRAHYFTFVKDESGRASDDLIHCSLQRVIEDTFSMVVCFRQKGNACDRPDAVLTWIIDKEKWTEVRDRVLSGEFTLRLDRDRLILLRETL